MDALTIENGDVRRVPCGILNASSEDGGLACGSVGAHHDVVGPGQLELIGIGVKGVAATQKDGRVVAEQRGSPLQGLHRGGLGGSVGAVVALD